jgi:Glycosyltransferase family 87
VPFTSRSTAWLLAVIALASVMYVVRVRFEMADFAVYRTAGQRALQAEPLYRADDGHYQFKYLPAFALAMAPLAWVGPEVAKAAWYALSVALLWVFVASSVHGLPDRRRSTAVLVWLTILLMAKFYAHELNLGQTNVLLGVVLVSGLLAAQRGHALLAGALVGIGVFVKPYAVILLPWLLPGVGVQGVAAAAVVLAIGLLMPALVYGWTGNVNLVVEWYRTVTDTTAPNLLLPENVSIATMWAKWLGPGALASRMAVATVAVAVVAVAWAVGRRSRVPAPAYLEFGLLMLLVPLISPQGWDYVLLVATPAVVCLVDRFSEMTPPWRTATALAAGLMSFTIFDLLGRALYSRLMAVNIVSVAALALFVALTHVRARGLA